MLQSRVFCSGTRLLVLLRVMLRFCAHAARFDALLTNLPSCGMQSLEAVLAALGESTPPLAARTEQTGVANTAVEETRKMCKKCLNEHFLAALQSLWHWFGFY